VLSGQKHRKSQTKDRYVHVNQNNRRYINWKIKQNSSFKAGVENKEGTI
tara:strand:+ start:246 stop:392 length:147 start_codon:yes stop_codon:yes gene_type:complete